jgi:hypothetical protein
MWSGKDPKNSAPEIMPIGVDDQETHKGIYLEPGSQHMAYTEAKDADGDQLYYYWEIYPESTEKKEGGDVEAKPVPVEGSINDPRTKALSFKAPLKTGPYRLFVTVYDAHNHVAFANAPFYVKK